jgi:glycogen debranching enzyme
MQQTVSILDGSTFLVSSENGDIKARPEQPEGLFFRDTRHLSLWKLTVNNLELDALSTDTIEYYFAQFFCVPPTGTIYQNPTLSIIRQRMVGDGFVEELSLLNHGTENQQVEIRLQAAADFADIFEIKDALPKKGEHYHHIRTGQLVLGYKREGYIRETIIAASIAPTEIDEDRILFRVILAPKQCWRVQLQVKPATDDVEYSPKFADSSLGNKLRDDLAQWIESAPALTSYPDQVRQLYMRSLVDIAALRFHPETLPEYSIPAAGLPWFMAMFGRDSILTSFQALPFMPELASTTLRVLADTQGKVEDDFREEEPGKILHELRFGELTHFKERPQSPYFGTSDATPLYLVLMDEYERWSGDTELVRSLEKNARAALEWIDQFGDSDGDGYIEYQRKTNLGLENQCWKDSWNSILFADGRVAPSPIATCEIQGYAYDAKVRCARLAKTVWHDAKLASRLEKEAAEMKKRFNRDFYIPERQFFALALDGDKQRVDSLSSNIGHLLWSGIVDDDKAAAVAKHLMSPELFSGWGVRTMATSEAGYNPIEYHNGTVWPHDNSIIAAGLARYGYRAEAARVISGMMTASIFFRFRLPEVFAGYAREETGFPVQYPTASSPQAWAAGAPLLGIRTLLGLEPHGEVLTSDPVLPEWIGTLALEGIPGRWGKSNVVAEQKGSPSYKQLYGRLMTQRQSLGDKNIAA